MFLLANISLPDQASTIAADVDLIYNVVMWLSLAASAAVLGTMAFFAIKYKRRSPHDPTPHIPGSHKVELVWTIVPAIVLLSIAAWGVVIYHDMENPPDNAFAIHVTGKQWFWEFTYGNGKKAVNELRVPVGRPTVMQMASSDVLHSFFVPSFRVKKDLVPGYRTQLWFTPTKTGAFNLFCAEYCGTNHSGMLGKVIVMGQSQFDEWYSQIDEGQKTVADLGADLFKSKGCFSCHSVDGSALVGPSLKAMWGRKTEFADGSSSKTDDNYIRDSLMNPMAKVVKGFPPIMPPYQGQLTEDEVTQLIEYLKTLK